ncbi:MAG: hypothetical protein WGN25_10755 [Candidatus Electrothrix sp. GW3-4]|uniref:hypothetical protein n=1 Tax=Candidatus Electrothrix sp. GW3-4 TaxID=3126740 RepID=UPI0030D05FA1
MKEKKKQRGRTGTVGFCQSCGQEHSLPAAQAQEAAFQLIKNLERSNRIDLSIPALQANPRCSLDYLWGPARGKMFGVLVGQAPNGEQVHLRAFSGQYNGLWQVPGWVGPVFDLNTFHQVHDQEEREIKKLTHEIAELPADAQERQELLQARKKKSQQLMREIHNLYQLCNFHGQRASLQEILGLKKGVPTGTGDCCAPKLLQHAALHGLTPLGLSEFYLGKENASGARQHGCFYPSCQTKCYPILGFMLCGVGHPEKTPGETR